MLEPYAIKVARTVLRGGKTIKSYLSQLDTLLVHTVNNECKNHSTWEVQGQPRNLKE
jgi:hypothetical protein